MQTLSVLVFRTSLISEVLKVNEFIEHFIEHRQQNEDFSIVDFIKIHYIDKQVFDDDYAQDMSLPFKTSSVQFSIPLEITEKIEFSLPLSTCLNCNKITLQSDLILSESFVGGIWQPPRA